MLKKSKLCKCKRTKNSASEYLRLWLNEYHKTIRLQNLLSSRAVRPVKVPKPVGIRRPKSEPKTKRIPRTAEESREIRRERDKHRRKHDINWRLMRNLRCRLNRALQNNQKQGSAVDDLGCSIPDFRKHLFGLFKPGMTWKNYGKGKDCWNIDHIMPLFAFNLVDRQHFLLANHYLNLRPLWSAENATKCWTLPEDYLAKIKI